MTVTLTFAQLNDLSKDAAGQTTVAVPADTLTALVAEVRNQRLDRTRLEAVAYMALGRPVTDDDDGLVECWSCTADRYAGTGPCFYCKAPHVRPAPTPGYIEDEVPAGRVTDLMDALFQSVENAKADRAQDR